MHQNSSIGSGFGPNGTARIAWRGQSNLNASQILPSPADEEEKKNARDADIAERTLKRAKADLRVKSTKEGDGSWVWSLPPKEAEGGHEPRCSHGYPDGVGCYLCDPEHPYRLRKHGSIGYANHAKGEE